MYPHIRRPLGQNNENKLSKTCRTGYRFCFQNLLKLFIRFPFPFHHVLHVGLSVPVNRKIQIIF